MENVINTETWSVCFMFCIQTINAQNKFLKQEFWNWDAICNRLQVQICKECNTLCDIILSAFRDILGLDF